MGLGGQPGARDPQCQRQPVAERAEPGGGLRVGGDPLRSGHRTEHGGRLRLAEHVQLDAVYVVVAGEVVDGVPAGDQYTAVAAARQQRPDLRERPGVVEHHQDPFAVQDRPVQRGPLVLVARYLGPRHAERAQEPVEHGGRRLRRVRLVVAAQVGEELAVREPPGDLVGPVHRERALADPGDAGDGRHGERRLLALPVEQPVEQREFPAAPGERGGRRGELRGHGTQLRGDLGLRRQGQLGVVPQDQFVQLLQLGAGLDAQLLHEHLASLAEDLQRLGPSPRTVLGQHQMGPGLFPQRVLADQRGQVGDE